MNIIAITITICTIHHRSQRQHTHIIHSRNITPTTHDAPPPRARFTPRGISKQPTQTEPAVVLSLGAALVESPLTTAIINPLELTLTK